MIVTLTCFLVDVVPGLESQGHFTPWNREEEYMWQCLSKAPDCFSMRCAATCIFQLPLVVTCPVRLFRPTWSPDALEIHDLETAAGKSVADIAACLSVSEASLHSFTADPFCMQIHGLFAHLMQHKCWSSIMCRLASLPTSRQAREFQAHNSFFSRLGLPTQAFSQQLAHHRQVNGRRLLQVSDSSAGLCFNPDAAAQLRRDLQRWAPRILDSCEADESASDRMALEEHLQRLCSFVEANSGASAGATVLRRRFYDANRIIKSLCAAMKLRDRGDLGAVLQTALEALPEFAGFQTEHFRVPHKSTLSRCQVRVDMMYSLFWRDYLSDFKGLAFAWVDSSPQGGTDWLIALIRVIRADDVNKCFEAACLLEKTVAQVKQAFQSDDSDALVALVKERWRCRQLLEGAICIHRLLPGGIGSGAAKVDQKLSSFCCKLFAETQSLAALKGFLQCIRGFCTDSGTEMSLADASGVSLQQVLPTWMVDPLSFGDGDGDALDSLDMNVDVVSRSPAHNPASNLVFPNALICPGALHVCHSMVQEVDQALTHFETWLPEFKAVVHLLNRDHLRQRFLATCVLGSQFDWMQHRVRKLAEPAFWRWNAMANILQGVVKMKSVLQATWSQARFLKPDGADKDSPEGLDVDLLSCAIRSDSFWAYTCMLCALHSLAEDISSWFEGCPCHSPLTQVEDKEGAVSLKNTLQAACDAAGVPRESPENCPLAGQRSAELASGVLLRHVDLLSDSALEFFLRQTNSQTDPELLETVLTDYSRGRAHFTEYLSQKLQCWETLPWKFAALTHFDPVCAQMAASEIVTMLEKSPKDEELHHRVTWQFLRAAEDGGEAALLIQLRQLARPGSSLCRDPGLALLQEFAQGLKFLPTVERIVEAQHGSIKKGMGFRKVSGAYVSTSLRMPEMKKLFTVSTQYKQLLENWSAVLNPDEAAKRFGLFNHPRYQDACAERMRKQQKFQILGVLLYMLDPESQFRSIEHVRKQREKQKQKKQAAKDKFFKNLNGDLRVWSLENVERRAVAQHMQDRMEPGLLYSLPVDSTALPSLQSRLEAPGVIKLPEQLLESRLAEAAEGLSLNPGSPTQQDLSLAVCQGHGAADSDGLEAVENVPIMFLRLSRKAPSRSRVLNLPAASGVKLGSTDMTVTAHACVRSPEACWVEVEPRKAEGVLSSASVLSISKTDAETVPFVLRQWSTCKKLVYRLRGQPATPALASLLADFVSQRAFPGTRQLQHVRVSADSAESISLCEGLEHAGYIVRSSANELDSTWAMTDKGLQHLVHMHEVCQPTLVFRPLEDLLLRVGGGLQEVQDFSSWELLTVLKNTGWQLAPIPAQKKSRRKLPPLKHDSTSLVCYGAAVKAP